MLRLFIWLIGNVYHTPKVFPNVVVGRGELVMSLDKIAENNEHIENNAIIRWSRMKVSRMLHWLDEREFISVTCDGGVTRISVCNYDFYQTQDNYTCDSGVTAVLPIKELKELKEEKESTEKTSCPRSKKRYSDDDMRLANLLSELITKNKPDRKVESTAIRESWANACRMMREIDNRTPSNIEAVVRWCQSDEFWRRNILSFSKLREQFDRLELQMRGNGKRPGKVDLSDDSRFDEMRKRYARGGS